MGALATRAPAALASIQPTFYRFTTKVYIRLCNKMVTSGGGWEGPPGVGGPPPGCLRMCCSRFWKVLFTTQSPYLKSPCHLVFRRISTHSLSFPPKAQQ